ncbi:MAG: alpha-hydroxy-acid oxidizing protein, partial [Comamonadaceae bacterium]
LPAVRDAVPDRIVMLDGGIRRGTDVAKALALGAACTFAGRPMLFAVAAAGEAGVVHALALLRSEIDRTQALAGVEAIAQFQAAQVVFRQA